MRILIVRHADPDYGIDSLTETGWKEAQCLSERLAKEKIDYIYCSPLGRARDTASLTLKAKSMQCQVEPWLREFAGNVYRPDRPNRLDIAWDWLPQDYHDQKILFDADKWYTHPVMARCDVKKEYDWVISNFDKLLEKHGYRYQDGYWQVLKPNDDTICLFCHFGVESVLLSRIMHISPFSLWHTSCAAPSSVTTIYTEERRPGIAAFRICGFADVSHLYVHDRTPSFSARFCELYTNQDERHD